jgi:hypothetical protein
MQPSLLYLGWFAASAPLLVVILYKCATQGTMLQRTVAGLQKIA